MLLKNIQFRKLTLGFGVLFMLLVSIVLIASESMATIDEDTILKTKYSYPQRDEYKFLPGCCEVVLEKIKFKKETGRVPQKIIRAQTAWRKKLGGVSMTWLHHFCAGINRIGRFERSLANGIGGLANLTKKQRGTLVYALDEFNMIEPSYLKGGSPLYVETVYHHAKALHYLRRTKEAIYKLKQGIAAKPNKEKLYLYLAKIFLEIGYKKQAKEVLNLGYKRTKGSKRIGKMLSRLK